MTDRGHLSRSAPTDWRHRSEVERGLTPKSKIEQLDFGVRNTLLYYKDLKATLDLTPGAGADPAAVSHLLGSHRVSVSDLFPTPDTLREATKRVRAISYRARRDLDKGAPGTLCLTWGMATWDNSRATTPAAPILLRQASVGRHVGTAEDFDLGVSGPWSLNTTLLRLLEIDFGVDVERHALGDLVEELPGHGDPTAVFERMTKMASEVPGFSIAARVVLAPVPRAVMVVDRSVAGYPDGDVVPPPDGGPPPVPETTGPAITVDTVETASPDPAEATTPDVAEEATVLTAVDVFDPSDLSDETAGEVPDDFGPDVVIAEITAVLVADHWPEALIEHMGSGLRVRSQVELLERWYDASGRVPPSSAWDATHFALWGLTAAPTSGIPAIQALRQWGDRRHHPVLVAWQVVAERRLRRNHSWPGHKRSLRHRLAVPKGIDKALWGLPVDLLVEWSSWVFRQWPGAPMDLVLPAGTAELVTPWYERARPVAEMAVRTWVQFSPTDEELHRAAHRWVKDLSTACAGGGEPLAVWFEKSRAAASAAVGRRVGMTVPARGRPPYGGAAEAHQRAI